MEHTSPTLYFNAQNAPIINGALSAGYLSITDFQTAALSLRSVFTAATWKSYDYWREIFCKLVGQEYTGDSTVDPLLAQIRAASNNCDGSYYGMLEIVQLMIDVGVITSCTQFGYYDPAGGLGYGESGLAIYVTAPGSSLNTQLKLLLLRAMPAGVNLWFKVNGTTVTIPGDFSFVP